MKPILHCLAVEAIVEDGVIKGIITESKSGRRAILAKRVIDCTGDADIAALAGAPFSKAPKEQLMNVTTLFNCKGVDVEKFNDWVENVLKPTYKDWGGYWSIETTGKEDHMFSPYIERPFVEAPCAFSSPTIAKQPKSLLPSFSDVVAMSFSISLSLISPSAL